MSIDPEFDPFLERMPLSRRFYLDVVAVCEERSNEVADLVRQEYGIEAKDMVSLVPFDADVLTESTVLEADRVGYFTLYSSQKSETLMGRDPTPAMIIDAYLYADGSPWVAEQDLDFLEAHVTDTDSSDISMPRYIIIVNPEQPPVAVTSLALDWADRQLTEQTRGQEPRRVIHDTELLDFLKNHGYQPHILTDQDCANVLQGVCSAPIERKLVLEYIHSPEVLDGEVIRPYDGW